MLSLPIYFRVSTYYLHLRINGKQVKRSLYTSNRTAAIIKASKLLEALHMGSKPSSISKYEIDLEKGIAKADGAEDHRQMMEAMQLLTALNKSVELCRILTLDLH